MTGLGYPRIFATQRRASLRPSRCPGVTGLLFLTLQRRIHRLPAGQQRPLHPYAEGTLPALTALAAECGDQVLDPAGLFFGGGFLRLDGLDEVLTQTHAVRRFLGRQLGAPAGDVQPLTQRRSRPVAAVSISSS